MNAGLFMLLLHAVDDKGASVTGPSDETTETAEPIAAADLSSPVTKKKPLLDGTTKTLIGLSLFLVVGFAALLLTEESGEESGSPLESVSHTPLRDPFPESTDITAVSEELSASVMENGDRLVERIDESTLLDTSNSEDSVAFSDPKVVSEASSDRLPTVERHSGMTLCTLIDNATINAVYLNGFVESDGIFSYAPDYASIAPQMVFKTGPSVKGMLDGEESYFTFDRRSAMYLSRYQLENHYRCEER